MLHLSAVVCIGEYGFGNERHFASACFRAISPAVRLKGVHCCCPLTYIDPSDITPPHFVFGPPFDLALYVQDISLYLVPTIKSEPSVAIFSLLHGRPLVLFWLLSYSCFLLICTVLVD